MSVGNDCVLCGAEWQKGTLYVAGWRWVALGGASCRWVHYVALSGVMLSKSVALFSAFPSNKMQISQ